MERVEEGQTLTGLYPEESSQAKERRVEGGGVGGQSSSPSRQLLIHSVYLYPNTSHMYKPAPPCRLQLLRKPRHTTPE